MNIADNEAEDHAERFSMPSKPDTFTEGWSYRTRCDVCRRGLGFGPVNLAIPKGTPILCGPCARTDGAAVLKQIRHNDE